MVNHRGSDKRTEIRESDGGRSDGEERAQLSSNISVSKTCEMESRRARMGHLSE